MDNIPHYRRNFEAGHDNETAKDVVSRVLLAGLQRLRRKDEFETYGDLFREHDFLLELVERIND